MRHAAAPVAQAAADAFACSLTDGRLKVISRSGRVEKSVDAHQGACTHCRWAHDGSAVATAGEDGQVKIWSRSGMLRSTLASLECPVYALAWGAGSDNVLMTNGKELVIRSIQPSARQTQWKAHEGVVLCVDWSAATGLIVSGGEGSGRYKVWDAHGRLLFQSAPQEHPCTSVRWSPDGELFCAGTFRSVRVCSRGGWTHAKAKLPQLGSVQAIDWTPDGAALALAGAAGRVALAAVVGWRAEWRGYTAVVEASTRVVVEDASAGGARDELDVRDRVVKLALGHGHLVVATVSQCYIYRLSNLNTPQLLDLKEPVTLLSTCDEAFVAVDHTQGIRMVSYDGRQLCAIRFQGLNPARLSAASLSASPDLVAVVDSTDPRMVRLFDSASGRPLESCIQHSMEVTEVALSQRGSLPNRMVVFLDRNRDLWICHAIEPKRVHKLGAMVDSVQWSDEADILGAIADGKLLVWYYPAVVFVDRDLLKATTYSRDGGDLGRTPSLASLGASACRVACGDGASLLVALSPHPAALHELGLRKEWSKATRLCRQVKDPQLWAALAVMAIANKQLAVAEAGYAALDAVDKLQYIASIKELPTEEARNAELALFRRRPDEAEAILLQSGMTFRAIYSNLRLFAWERALELAVGHKTHVDTVLWYRAGHLKEAGRTETSERYLELAGQVDVDEGAVKAKLEAEGILI